MFDAKNILLREEVMCVITLMPSSWLHNYLNTMQTPNTFLGHFFIK